MPNNSLPGYERYSEGVFAELCRIHKDTMGKKPSSRAQVREKARAVMRSVGKDPISDMWILRMESSLYYATGCTAEARYASSVRDAIANLRRSSSAHLYPADTWAFLPLIVLARDNRPVHLQRIGYHLEAYEKSGKITPLDRKRLELEICQYEESEPSLWGELMSRLAEADKPDAPEEDWEGEEPCPHCKSRKTRLFQQLQMKSADEPMTNFYHCHFCEQNFTIT